MLVFLRYTPSSDELTDCRLTVTAGTRFPEHNKFKCVPKTETAFVQEIHFLSHVQANLKEVRREGGDIFFFLPRQIDWMTLDLPKADGIKTAAMNLRLLIPVTEGRLCFETYQNSCTCGPTG